MSRPLNFLHLTTFYPPYNFGGDGMQVYRLCHALANAGHHVDVIHDVDAFRMFHPAGPELAFAEHPGVARHELRSGFGSLSPLLTHQTGRPFLKGKTIGEVLALRQYDAIHFHNISLLGPQVLEMAAQRQKQAAILYTAHEHWLVCTLNVLWKMDRAPCDKPDCIRCALHSRRPPQFWRYTGFLEKMARNVDQFLAPSKFTAAMHAERGFPEPFACLPNFLERADEDWQTPAPRPHATPYFLFVGRLERIKGLQTLIALWDRAPACDLLVAGSGTYEAELRRLAAGNPRIRFLGPKTQSELGALYFHALACVVPSITFETFGMTSIEAFARKTPTIVRDLGALPELVQESGGGFIYRTDEELVEALHKIAGSSTLRDELGQRGYETFLRLWTREAHLRQYFEVIGRIR